MLAGPNRGAGKASSGHHGPMAVNLVDIEDRLLEASAGPWWVSGNAVVTADRTIAGDVRLRGDADFIANAWDDVTILMNDLVRLRGATDIAVEVIRLIRGDVPTHVQVTLDGVIDQIEAARQ
jgi:hypothetical protein